MSTNARSDIQIYKKDGVYRVRPATLAAARGGTVIFYNAGPATVLLVFPEGKFRDTGKPCEVKTNDIVSLTVAETAPYGKNPYAVYWREEYDRDFAVGESGPVIIIDR